MTESKRGGPGRGQGRKPVKAGEDTVTVSLRMTPTQRDRLGRLGGAGWVRDRIDEAPDKEEPTVTIRNPFKDERLKKTFDGLIMLFQTRHKDLFSSDGQPHRLNGFASPFWRGYFGEVPGMVIKGTPAQASYRAGQACRKAFDVQFERNGMTIHIDSAHHYPQQFPESKSQ